MNKAKDYIISSVFLLIVFLAYTYCVLHIDVRAIGPMGTEVGLGFMNSWGLEVIGTHTTLKTLSDLLGYLAFGTCGILGCYGLYQWVTRKNLWKVDSYILLLGVFYVLVIGCYFLFNFVVINTRPVLENGVLEASYPSSHTVLAICVFMSVKRTSRALFCGKPQIFIPLGHLCNVLTFLAVSFRFLSGVHWVSDIIGGILLSAFLLSLLEVGLQKLDIKV